MVMEIVGTNDPEMDDMGRVMEAPTSVLGDERMGCTIVIEPLLLDIPIERENKENGGPIEVATSLSTRPKISNKK